MTTTFGVPTEARVLQVLDEYLAALRAGHAPDREALLARHPDLAESLAASFRALDFVHGAGRTLEDSQAPRHGEEPASEGRVLGDYRFLREIARGGMAVVYEAEQVSLGRRVALKVLPFAAVLDPRQLQRFQHEAQAVAQLQHPHIVPIYAVGCERGVHYYAMRYIEGQSLAVAIREMKEGAASSTGPRTPISSHGSNREPAYVRMAATLGVQAAEALDHAHQLGIVHRDVKPGNLLIDVAGSLWIADFGLAHSMKDMGLTMTGELLGTIRYMSPEQALAKRVPIDHRTDVYSLGATLYELLTLEPAFPGDDAHVVLKDIASKEPVPPRRINPAIPQDLETVLLKAMAKEPGTRYATAQEMADDLGRFLEHRPIEAKRPGLVRRATKWSRRHRALVGTAIGVLLFAVAGLATGTALLWKEKQQTGRALEQARTEYGRAKATLAIALDALDEFYVDQKEAQPRIREGMTPELLQKGLGFYEAFARQNPSDPDVALLTGTAHHRVSRILVELGEEGRAKEALGRALVIFEDLVRQQPDNLKARLYLGHVLADRRDFDEAAREFRRIVARDPGNAHAHYFLGNALFRDHLDEAIQEYGEAIRLKSDLADAHFNLGNAFRNMGKRDDAIREFQAVARLEPKDATVRVALGNELYRSGKIDDAIASYREAIELDPKSAGARASLGAALLDKGEPNLAIQAGLEAIRLDPKCFVAYNNLGNAYRVNGELDAGIASCLKAIELKPDSAMAYYSLGALLDDKHDFDGAIEKYRKASHLAPDDFSIYRSLGITLVKKRDYDGAIVAFGNAIRIKSDDADVYSRLGHAYLVNGDPGSAVPAFLEAIRLKQDFVDPLLNLGHAYTFLGRPQDALTYFRRGHELASKSADRRAPTGEWVASAERMVELDKRLERVLSGEARPTGAPERVEFAELLNLKSRHAQAARMYAEAFVEDPALAEDLAKGSRYNAACSALRAAADGGAGAAELRGLALEWLRADLAAREKASSDLADMLRHWKHDRDLASIRDRIADLPEAEREAWRGFWAAVDQAIASAPPTSR